MELRIKNFTISISAKELEILFKALSEYVPENSDKDIAYFLFKRFEDVIFENPETFKDVN